MNPPPCPDPIGRARSLAGGGGRVLLGLAGAPGAGKSTLARHLADALGPGVAAVVPMDGFHLANAELARLGRAERKGAPDTFDAAGFVALLRRLSAPVAGETVYAPAFHRAIEEPVAGAIPVDPAVTLVIVEGNYLLLDGAWAGVRPLLAEAWFVEAGEARRHAWLLARHIAYGRTAQDAAAWVESTDEPNARLIRMTRARADCWVQPAAVEGGGFGT